MLKYAFICVGLSDCGNIGRPRQRRHWRRGRGIDTRSYGIVRRRHSIHRCRFTITHRTAARRTSHSTARRTCHSTTRRPSHAAAGRATRTAATGRPDARAATARPFPLATFSACTFGRFGFATRRHRHTQRDAHDRKQIFCVLHSNIRTGCPLRWQQLRVYVFYKGASVLGPGGSNPGSSVGSPLQ